MTSMSDSFEENPYYRYRDESDMRDAGQEAKRAEHLGKLLDYILMVTTTKPHAVPQVNVRMDDFDITKVWTPNAHRTGNLKIGNLLDGVALRTTTINASNLTQRLHNLYIYTGYLSDDPLEMEQKLPRYQVSELIPGSGGSFSKPDEYVGVEEMAAAPYDLGYDITIIRTVLDYERLARWRIGKIVTPNDVVHERRVKARE